MNSDAVAAKARRIIRKWQPILRLQDWDFTVEVKRRFELGDGNQQGLCTHNMLHRHAYIKLLDPQDFDPGDRPCMNDIEDTIVHEMMHVVVAGFSPKDGTPEEVYLENAVNATTAALLKLDRRAPRLPQRRRKERT